MKKTTLGLAMCGSFCTFSRVLDAFEALDRERFDLVPIMSQVSFETDSRFGPAAQFRERLEALCGREIVHTIEEAEPFGPKKLLDVLVIMPCTGNTLAKLASGIADGPVTLAAKAHLRNERPVIVAVSTNDGLAGNAANLGALLNRRGYYFVPFGQDSAFKKPRSLVADFAKRRRLSMPLCAVSSFSQCCMERQPDSLSTKKRLPLHAPHGRGSHLSANIIPERTPALRADQRSRRLRKHSGADVGLWSSRSRRRLR